ncbi:uncharacterized protein LOC119111381 [Pollicipes pollicipes]|uniref:uncharacterized protein LOC119111381 n=1 Tax=Pollicipes pollicipes TaxID=41117 RepID=UPI001884A242|nr:uncharacterized protein LOC119111381 [Pollicipes pollicipes]
MAVWGRSRYGDTSGRNGVFQLSPYDQSEDLDAVRCAQFSLPDLVIGAKASRVDPTEGTSFYECDVDHVLVTLISPDARFNRALDYHCAAVEAPYMVDRNDCDEVVVTDAAAMQSPNSDDSSWPFQCPQLPEAAGIFSFRYDLQDQDIRWRSIKCCRIKQMS